MTATDPRPALAAALAAEALAATYADDMERRLGPVPPDKSRASCLIECSVSGRAFVGRPMTPEFRAWRERQNRRTEANIARCLDSAGSAGPDRRQAMTATPPHDKT